MLSTSHKSTITLNNINCLKHCFSNPELPNTIKKKILKDIKPEHAFTTAGHFQHYHVNSFPFSSFLHFSSFKSSLFVWQNRTYTQQYLNNASECMLLTHAAVSTLLNIVFYRTGTVSDDS